MNFASDNWAGASPQINAALAEHGGGFAAAYGSSDLDEKARQKIGEIFEKDVSVLFVPTGTAANSLAAALMMRPGGIVLAHRESHMIEDECGAPELLSGGGRLVGVDGIDGKIDPVALAQVLKRHDPPFLHYGRPVGMSITQATEVGTVYRVREIAALTDLAATSKLPVHMDGARFANAIVRLDKTPAELTWKAGIDFVSFGASKNGCWCAEALVIFDRSLQEEAEYLRKRAGHLFSKSRFVAAQYLAWLENDLWLDLARHANSMAEELARRISQSGRVKLAWECEANSVFVYMEEETSTQMREAGARFYSWHLPAGHTPPGDVPESCGLFRLVTSFATTPAEIESFSRLLERS